MPALQSDQSFHWLSCNPATAGVAGFDICARAIGLLDKTQCKRQVFCNRCTHTEAETRTHNRMPSQLPCCLFQTRYKEQPHAETRCKASHCRVQVMSRRRFFSTSMRPDIASSDQEAVCATEQWCVFKKRSLPMQGREIRFTDLKEGQARKVTHVEDTIKPQDWCCCRTPPARDKYLPSDANETTALLEMSCDVNGSTLFHKTPAPFHKPTLPT